MTKRVWTRDEIKTLLQKNDKMVSRSVVKLYEYQTASEQENNNTRESNGVGFNAVDASFLTSIAERVISGRPLTDKQIKATRKAILKYTGQLTEIANLQTAQ